MIGLIVQLTAELVKIWPNASHRLITYSVDELPKGCHEGDWIDILYNSNRTLQSINRRRAYLETKRDDRGKLQVLDVFLVDSRREEAFSETFGMVRVDRGRGGERWTEEGTTKDNCFQLWMTISSNAEFSMEEQSLERIYSKDGEYSDKYKRLMKEFHGVQAPTVDPSEDYGEFDEMILIVGFHEQSMRYFSSSRCGEGFINESLWTQFKNENKMERGACFRARLERLDHASGTLHRVVMLYERVQLSNGVHVNMTDKDVNVTLNADVVERRETCFALETELFGLVTYPLDKRYLNSDIHVGDSLRVTVHRYKNDSRDDHPSKWQVTRVAQVFKRAAKEDESELFESRMMNSDSDCNNQGQESFSETILIVGCDDKSERLFSSSCSGEAVIPRSVWKKHGKVKLGDVFRATLCSVVNSAVRYEVVNLEKRMEVWEGVEVKCHGKDVRAVLNGTIVQRRETCFALETISFGLITYPLGLGVKGIPENVKIDDHLRVKVMRFKNASRPDYPSKWQVTSLKQRLQPPPLERDWFEGIVTAINGNRAFVSFKLGNALYYHNFNQDSILSLGTVVRICVRDTGRDNFFEVLDIDTRTRRRDDITVEMHEELDRTIFSVTCPAEVLERRDGYFLLDTPIIGNALFFFKECPKSMRVGDVWEVKMHRRKEKREWPSYWVAHAVVSDSPRSVPTHKSKWEEEKKGDRGNVNEASEDNGQWTTVIIFGSKANVWFGSCYAVDFVIIPFSLVGRLAVPERGTFYRIKFSKETDVWKAYAINPEPVYPKDIDVVRDDRLQVWCYARIESSQSTWFTLSNYILGRATLPHKFAHPQMRVGDEIEALYYRVKSTNNPTNWMVQRVGIATGRSNKNSEAESGYHENRDRSVKEERSYQYSEKESGSRQSSEIMESPSGHENEKVKDRRMLDKMRYLMGRPGFREIFQKKNADELKMIEKILEKDLRMEQEEK